MGDDINGMPWWTAGITLLALDLNGYSGGRRAYRPCGALLLYGYDAARMLGGVGT